MNDCQHMHTFLKTHTAENIVSQFGESVGNFDFSVLANDFSAFQDECS